MATKAKDSPVKEKRGKSPSNLRHTDPTQRRKSPNPPSSFDHQKPVSTSNPSDHRNVPNYLRPTISSRLDTSKNSATKKPSPIISSDTTPNKPTVNRRRSFDKPPPPSQLPKTHTSPTSVEKNPRPTSATKAKPTSTLTKPLPEKVAKAFSKDVGKPHTLYSRPVKNVKKTTTSTTGASSSSTTTTKKHSSTSTNASATKAPISTTDHSANIEDTPKHEPLQEDHGSSVTKAEDEETASNGTSNDGFPAEVLIMEDKEHDDISPAEADQPEETEESEEEVKKLGDSSTVSEKQHTIPVSKEQNATPTVEMEETEPDEIHIDGPENKEKETDDESENEKDNKNHQEESFESEPIVVVDSEKNNEGGEESGTEEHPKEKGLEEKEEVNNEGNKGSKPENDTQEVEEVAKEVKQEAKEVKPEVKEVKPEETQKIVVPKQQGSKKETTAYNDVIEETASKLREQRRNKVKALVGAFETVISLEDPESETPRGN